MLSSMHGTRVEICGNIASGKTTLSYGFAKAGYVAIEENFLINPFIDKFYQDPRKYSFETEISFLLQHYHSIKSTESLKTLICDFSFTLDKAYADVTLSSRRRNLFLAILDEITQEIGDPALIIYLKCPEQVLLSRIQARGRMFEVPIQIDYLQKLSETIDSSIYNAASLVPIVEIDSHQIDFREDISEIESLSSILNAFKE